MSDNNIDYWAGLGRLEHTWQIFFLAPTDENSKTQGTLLEKADGKGTIINEEKDDEEFFDDDFWHPVVKKLKQSL